MKRKFTKRKDCSLFQKEERIKRREKTKIEKEMKLEDEEMMKEKAPEFELWHELSIETVATVVEEEEHEAEL